MDKINLSLQRNRKNKNEKSCLFRKFGGPNQPAAAPVLLYNHMQDKLYVSYI